MSVEDYDIISTKLQDPGWAALFSRISAPDFGSIISHVNVDHDQPRVAALLAPAVNGGNFTSEYCAAAVKSTALWNRLTLLERLVPYCVDLRENNRLIRSELSEWDQIIASRSMFDSISDMSC